MITDHTDREPGLELESCPWCPTRRRTTHNTEGGIVGIVIHETGCFLAPHKYDRRQVLTPKGVIAWNSRVSVAGAAPTVDDLENSVAFKAYNQAIEDAKQAIRDEAWAGSDAAPSFINAIARRCSPHVYANRLADTAVTAAPPRSVQHLVNQWQAAWLSTQDISRDSEADLVRRIEALLTCTATSSSQPARDAAEQLERENFLLSDITQEERDQVTAIISKHFPAAVAPVESEWMPIETAPKGVDILLLWEDEHMQIHHFPVVEKPSFWFENAPIKWRHLPPLPNAAAPVAATGDDEGE